MVIYELDICCIFCGRNTTKDVSWELPKIGGRWHTFCPCNSNTRISIIESVEAAGEDIIDREEIEEWIEMFRAIGVSDAHEVIYAPGGEEAIDRVVKKRVWIYPVGSLRNMLDQRLRPHLQQNSGDLRKGRRN